MVRTSPRRRQRWRLVGCLLLLTALVAPVAPAAATAAPSIRLRAPGKVMLHQFDNRLYLDLGVLVAADAGAFEIQATRSTYSSPITAAQVDATTKEVLRPIPDELLAGWEGLRGFFQVEIRAPGGDLVRSRRINWCPNNWSGQRVDDTGPVRPRYPTMCGGWFPFTKGMVWGIDAGWASQGFGDYWDYGSSVKRVPPGDYEVTVRIRPPFARLFEVPRSGRSVTMQVTVMDGEPWDVEHREHAGGMALAGELMDEASGPMSAAEHSMMMAEALGDGAGAGKGDVPEDPLERGMTTDADLVPEQSVATIDEPDPSTLPDLVALPAWNIDLRTTRKGKELLGFASSPWNAGPAPFVIEGFRRGNEDLMDAYQYFFDADGKVVGRAPAGKLNFHRKKGHDHWHFLHFARFDLLDSTKQNIVKSRKQGFCLMPTDAIDLTVERATLRPDHEGFGTMCGGERAIWVREVLEAGWGDTYYQSVAGQAFDVTGLPNGVYYIKVTVNPLGQVRQVRTDNDEALRKVRIGGKPGQRWVRVTPWQGVDA